MDAISFNPQARAETTTTPPSHLTIILDTSPFAWNTLSTKYDLPLQTAVASLLVFTNAHLAFSTDNRVALLAAHCGRTEWLFPAPEGDAPLPPVNANQYRPFAVVEAAVMSRLNSLLARTTPQDIEDAGEESSLAGPLTLALTYTNRLNLSLSPNKATNAPTPADQAASSRTAAGPLAARILIVSVSAADLASQYIPLTNAMFAAQHAHIPIDVLKLAGDTALLQQAAFITGGRYIAPEGLPSNTGDEAAAAATKSAGKAAAGPVPVNLLPYLLHALLPDPTARAHLVPTTSPHVDFRAACFCHRNVVDMGFVCSICLSIFCKAEELEPDMACLTCGTRLVLGGEDEELPAEKKKKKKKNKEASGTPIVGTPQP